MFAGFTVGSVERKNFMYRRLFWGVCVILVLCLANSTAFGYPGQDDCTIVIGEPVIDGIISGGEWDSADWIDMDKVYSGSAPDLSAAKWAALWSPNTNLVYVAITGIDTQHIFNDSYVSWDTQDDVEIQIDAGNTDKSGYNEDNMRYGQHYFMGPNTNGGAWMRLAGATDAVMPGGYAVTVDGDRITYEFALTPYSNLTVTNPAGSAVRTLAIGDVIGLDMIMCTKSSSGFGMLCENQQLGKWKNAITFLDHTLVQIAPLTARDESPAHCRTRVADDVTLSWKPGYYTALHDVYFGTDYNDVNDADISDSAGIYRGRQNLDANSYNTSDYADGLCPGKTYYWRVDEVNDADPCSPWKGDVWRFTIRCDITVTDYIDYTDLEAFALQWLLEGLTPAEQHWYCCGADLDHNGSVGFLDFALLGARWLEPLDGGNVFYVDPVNGSMSGNGSYDYPWSTLQAVFENNKIESRDKNYLPINAGAPVKAGATIKLLSGNHGSICELGGYRNISNITVEPQAGHRPILKRWTFDYASNWTIRGLEFAYGMEGGCIVDISSSNNVTIEDCNIYSEQDSAGWTKTEWNTVPSGVSISGSNVIARNCNILNVDMGVSVSSNCEVIGCTIQNFAKDGIRSAGSNITMAYNKILDSYNVNVNHDDAIQLSPGGSNVAMRGNLVINDTTNGSRNYISGLQGICSFDDNISDCIIENNVVICGHYHGITMYHATNCTVANNTAYNPGYVAGGGVATWITITGGTGNKLINNLMHSSTSGSNLQVTSAGASSFYVSTNQSSLDLHLKPGSPAIDAGTAEAAPSVDFDGTPRPQGLAFDIGAYEYQP